MKEYKYTREYKVLKVKLCEGGDPKFDGVLKVVGYCKERFNPLVEEFYAFILDSKNRLIEAFKTEGTVNENVIYPRELFKRVLELNGVNVILAHNHPSGMPTPSRADTQMTRTLVDGAKLLGLTILDHIIFTDKAYTSFVQERMI